jgi:Pyruvate/2-oxoacid:ferredoxin oxidoreductase delta subunit
MTIFYFTSTGNCLAVAKKIGQDFPKSKLFSIPQVINLGDIAFKDDIIGLIFPIYGFGLPKMVRQFMEKAKWEADYSFAIGTYGNLPGAAMRNVQRLAAKQGNRFDYAESLLMVDNYLPGFEMDSQIAKLPEKQVDENLTRIITDIAARKKQTATAGILMRVATAAIGGGKFINAKQAQKFIVNENCIRCGICAKVCPAGNIDVTDTVAFADKCEGCLGCVHLCPKNAIHMRNEKSAARWRHPDVALNEIVEANNRQ